MPVAGKEVSLNERISILGFIPERDDYHTMKTTKALALKVSLSDDEAKKYLIKVNKGAGFKVTEEGQSYTTTLDFTPEEEAFIQTRLKGLDEAKIMTEQYMSLYEKFVL